MILLHSFIIASWFRLSADWLPAWHSLALWHQRSHTPTLESNSCLLNWVHHIPTVHTYAIFGCLDGASFCTLQRKTSTSEVMMISNYHQTPSKSSFCKTTSHDAKHVSSYESNLMYLILCIPNTVFRNDLKSSNIAPFPSLRHAALPAMVKVGEFKLLRCHKLGDQGIVAKVAEAGNPHPRKAFNSG